ncbi:MAG: hypothetical protein LBF57_01925 [Holosporaceae bacterium]|jgi:hypothetical protein|nr:hypothetical protein [Holosporaceae bacterium]
MKKIFATFAFLAAVTSTNMIQAAADLDPNEFTVGDDNKEAFLTLQKILVRGQYISSFGVCAWTCKAMAGVLQSIPNEVKSKVTGATIASASITNAKNAATQLIQLAICFKAYSEYVSLSKMKGYNTKANNAIQKLADLLPKLLADSNLVNLGYADAVLDYILFSVQRLPVVEITANLSTNEKTYAEGCSALRTQLVALLENLYKQVSGNRIAISDPLRADLDAWYARIFQPAITQPVVSAVQPVQQPVVSVVQPVQQPVVYQAPAPAPAPVSVAAARGRGR